MPVRHFVFQGHADVGVGKNTTAFFLGASYRQIYSLQLKNAKEKALPAITMWFFFLKFLMTSFCVINVQYLSLFLGFEARIL